MIALQLEAQIGQVVSQQLPASQREPGKRVQHLIDHLAGNGLLDGVLRIPNTVGDLEVTADLRARRICAAVSLPAPDDRGGRARCNWLAAQLSDDVDRRLVIDAFAKNARTPTTATLAEVRENKDVLLGADKKEPTRFKVSLTREMGASRKAGSKSAGFTDSTTRLITDFYESVVQNLSPWTPKAPKITRPMALADGDGNRPESSGNLPGVFGAALPHSSSVHGNGERVSEDHGAQS